VEQLLDQNKSKPFIITARLNFMLEIQKRELMGKKGPRIYKLPVAAPHHRDKHQEHDKCCR
jgi:hypothetical protein